MMNLKAVEKSKFIQKVQSYQIKEITKIRAEINKTIFKL